MVAIRTREAERFLSAIPEDIFLFLIYGPDAGMGMRARVEHN